MDKTAQSILRYRWYIIALVISITIFFGFQVKDLKINSDIINSLPDADPDAALFKEIGEQFGGNNMGLIILETDNIFKPQVLEHIRLITDTLSEIEGISSVTSLTNIIDIKGGDFGLEIGKLVDDWNIPETEEELQKLKDRVFSKDMYNGVIVSKDGTATLIMFTLAEDVVVKDVANTVKEKTEQLNLPENIYFTGSPMLISYISDLMAADLTQLIPISFLLIAFILLLSFRSFRGVVLPILIAIIAIIWTLGLMALGNFSMTMISTNIPIILLAVGSAYAIHVLNRINLQVETDRIKAIKLALSFIIIPVVLAAITTAIGFMSFIFGAYLTMIRDFGIFTALGTFITALLSLVFVPSIIAVFSKWNHQNIDKKVSKSILSENIIKPLKSVLFKHPSYVFYFWAILILLSIGGIFKIQRSVNIQEYFKEGNPTRKAEDIMAKKFGGTKPVFVLVTGDMQDPEVLKTMIRTEEYMKQSPDVNFTQSVADLIIEISDVMGEGHHVPDERDKIEQLWFLLDGNEIMQRFVSEDLDQGVIISKFISPDNKSKIQFRNYMESFIKENSTEDCTLEITGMPYVDITMDKSLINSQLGSLSIAIICVIIFVGIILRSLKSGLYATIPIIAAIIILFGFMGIAKIPLNIGTVLVASVALGIGIDYSIHIISHFKYSFKVYGDVKLSLDETLHKSGKAILINVLSVSAGFLVLLFSDMVPLQYFGLLIALSMFGSGLGAITLLPVILILVHRKKNI